MTQTANSQAAELTCSRCGHTKSTDEFYAQEGAPTGYLSYCKVCYNIRRQENSVRVNETRTFGVEIECLVKVADTALNNSNNYNAHAYVAQKLTDAGVQCHAEGYNHNDRNYWKIVGDCTIQHSHESGEYRCMEIVSPPLAGKAGIAELRKALKVINKLGATANRSCGLHVHHDAHDLGLEGFKGLIKMYSAYETELDRFMPQSRRGNNSDWCRSVNYYNNLQDRLDAATDIWDITHCMHSRYVKLNTEAYDVHGTVEFRHHSGSVDFDKIVNWVSLTQAMVEKAHAGVAQRDLVLPTVDKLMTAIKARKVIRNYYSQRLTALAS